MADGDELQRPTKTADAMDVDQPQSKTHRAAVTTSKAPVKAVYETGAKVNVMNLHHDVTESDLKVCGFS